MRSFVLAVGLPQNYTAQMERDIAIKLAQELVQEIASERQVVYILIELRKLLKKNIAQRGAIPGVETMFRLDCSSQTGPRLSANDHGTV